MEYGIRNCKEIWLEGKERMSILGTDMEEIKTEYLKKVKEAGKRSDAIYIYGAGRIAVMLQQLLYKNHILVNGFCVTDKGNNPGMISGLPVIQVDELEADRKKTLFIIGTMKQKSNPMIQTLLSFGYTNYVEPAENINYLNEKKIEMIHRPALEITPKAGCSVHCRYCPQDIFCHAYFADKDRASMMELDLYKKCVDKTPPDCIIIFAGFVEPFFHPQAVEMMRYAADTGRDVSLYTTMVGMTPKVFEEIKTIPFYEVVLHTPDDEGYANIPMTEEYFEVLDMVLDAKKPDGRPFIDYANCQGTPHREILKHTSGKILITNELVDRAGNITYEEVYENSKKKGPILCERARDLNHNILLPDGSVVLCCMDFGMKHVLGNLSGKSYEELLTGEEMQQIKGAMQKETGEIICRQCSSAVEIG